MQVPSADQATPRCWPPCSGAAVPCGSVAAQKSRRLLLQMKRGGVDALDSSQHEPEPDMSLLETKADLSREAHDHFVAIHPEVMDTYEARDPRWGRGYETAGEDALVNVSVEKRHGGKLIGYIRIRSKTQGIALSLGDFPLR